MANCSDVPQPKRHLSLNDNQIDQLLDNAVPKNTKNSTKNWMNVFRGYVKTKAIANCVEEILDVDLPKVMERFYAEVRKDLKAKNSKGKNKENIDETPERYCNTSMKSMRAAINRYMKEIRKIDIIGSEPFLRANKIFEAVLKDNKAKGKGRIQHKEPITSADLERLNDYFSQYMLPNALILQQMVQFNLMYYLCRRGRENLTHMPKNTFDVSLSSLILSILLVKYRPGQ